MFRLVSADQKGVQRTVLAGVLAAACWAQSPQEQAGAMQRASIERQRASVAGQEAAIEARDGPASAQVKSARAQPALGWPVHASAAAAPPCDPLSPPAAARLIERAAFENGLAPKLLRAVIARESAFRPCAISPAGAVGLMQLMPATAQDMGVADAFDVEQNVMAGGHLLRLLLDRFHGSLGLALGAYNAGPSRVAAFGGIPPIPETKAYVSEILSRVQ